MTEWKNFNETPPEKSDVYLRTGIDDWNIPTEPVTHWYPIENIHKENNHGTLLDS